MAKRVDLEARYCYSGVHNSARSFDPELIRPWSERNESATRLACHVSNTMAEKTRAESHPTCIHGPNIAGLYHLNRFLFVSKTSAASDDAEHNLCIVLNQDLPGLWKRWQMS